jgi:dihydroxyacetone kinase
MKNSLKTDDVRDLMTALSADMQGASGELAELDGAMGDGDLGVTVTIAFRAAGKLAKKGGFAGVGDLLSKCAELIGEEAPSTFGTLLAAMFSGAAETVGDAGEIGAKEFASALKASAEKVVRKGKAARGDKTLLDALIPAAEAAERSVGSGGALAEAASAAALAAREGAEATVAMRSKIGRAGYLGERSVGNMDPGAAAVALMLESVSRFMN